jgi:predicted nucleic acid-binding Zn ribbon protein
MSKLKNMDARFEYPIDQVKSIILKFENANMPRRCYFFPKIPNWKQLHAIESYAFKAQSEKILFLYDNSLLGDASEGIMLTDQALYYIEALNRESIIPRRIAICNIRSARLRKSSTVQYLVINEIDVLNPAPFASKGFHRLSDLFIAISEINSRFPLVHATTELHFQENEQSASEPNPENNIKGEAGDCRDIPNPEEKTKGRIMALFFLPFLLVAIKLFFGYVAKWGDFPTWWILGFFTILWWYPQTARGIAEWLARKRRQQDESKRPAPLRSMHLPTPEEIRKSRILALSVLILLAIVFILFFSLCLKIEGIWLLFVIFIFILFPQVSNRIAVRLVRNRETK